VHRDQGRAVQSRHGGLPSGRAGDLLNENFRSLREDLDDDQKAKLRDMQRAWIAYRDSTCGFYADAIQGSLAVPMSAACAARETARRALLLKQFSGF
jgi:uncharacterized protein YecT (DUF1311 family)